VPVRVPVKPGLLQWAIDRAGWAVDDAPARFPWINKEIDPTFKQLETFAHAAHVPVGFLLLAEPPIEDVPIPDFRTRRNERRDQLSPDLRDTIYACQRRQAWFREFAAERGFERVSLVGSARIGDAPALVAAHIRTAIGFDMERRSGFKSWEAAFRQLIDLIESAGVLVSVNGIVGADTHRALDPREFGGFALVDDYAPLIFVNGADTKAAQIFTIIHELAHIVAGESALSDAGVARENDDDHEVWCNQVAAEVLIPRAAILVDYRGTPDSIELDRLAALYRVSTLVVLHRLFEVGVIQWEPYRARYEEELARVRALAQRKAGDGGGNYYYTQPLRLGRRFARAVVTDTRRGGTAYGEAYRLLGTAKPATFDRLAAELGVA